MLKVYQYFLDGAAASWCTLKYSDFEDEIVCNYQIEHDEEIPQGKLIKLMHKLENMDIGDHLYFENMEFVCFEMEEDEFNTIREMGKWY
jgi:hypothetical protein